MSNKKRIYLNEYNIPTGNSIYLPYSSGLLQAYAQQFARINDNYEFVKIFFQRDTVANIVNQYADPDVVGFSVSMWNYQLSLSVATELKRKFPECLIVFGGPHITKDEKFFEQYPFVDFVVYREGEIIFTDLLIYILNQNDPNKWVDFFEKQVSPHSVFYHHTPPKDLDIFPSPYVAGIFHNIIQSHPELEFKAIIETNRNCPFNCAFCYWGSNDIDRKIRYHSIEYIKQDLEWIAQNKIKYVFCADANFGMYKRDVEIAQVCRDIKEKYNYPEKFRVCYGKNATKNIFETAKILSESNLAKTVTLSVQSFYQPTLDSINRKNIKTSQFKELQQQYNAENIPTYTEIILGLPNETYDSFVNGLESAIQLTENNQMFIYHCQVLPNTTLADLEYQKQYGIKTVKIPLAEIHVTARQDNFVQEYDEIIIQTNTMAVEEWMQCTMLSWIVQLFHSLKIGSQITDWMVKTYDIDYMNIYEYLIWTHIPEIHNMWNIVRKIPEGQPRCQIDKQFGNIYYEMEELTYLNIVCDKDRFYDNLYAELQTFLWCNQKDWKTLDKDIFQQQKNLLPNVEDFDSLEDFATQTILYGRKNNKIVSTNA